MREWERRDRDEETRGRVARMAYHPCGVSVQGVVVGADADAETGGEGKGAGTGTDGVEEGASATGAGGETGVLGGGGAAATATMVGRMESCSWWSVSTAMADGVVRNARSR